MKNIIKYQTGHQSWVLWIWKRIINNLNFLAIATGSTGIGKSWFLISLAYLLDKDFEARQIVFTFNDVMDILDSDWFQKKKYKIIVFDEAQVEISNRDWQSLSNKLFNYLLSTFRHRNVILLFTSPFLDNLDIQSQKLLHVNFEIRSHNKTKKKTIVRPKILQWNSQKKKFYTHSLFVIRNEKYNKLIFWTIPKPPQHLITPYEEAKVRFTNKLNENIRQQLKGIHSVNSGGYNKSLTSRQREVYNLYKKLDNEELVGKKLGISQPAIAQHLNLIRKKGYDDV